MLMSPGLPPPALAVTLLVSAFTIGCAASERPASPPPDHLRVVVVPFLSFAPFHIAAAEGYFERQNLDVELVNLTKTSDAIPALITGEVDVASGLLTAGILNAIAKAGRIRIVADKGYLPGNGCTFNAIIARRALVEAHQLDNPTQLKGRRFDLDVLLPEAYYVDRLLQGAGLSFDDLEIVNVPPPAEVNALANGSIDLTVATEPDVTRLVQTGTAVVWRPAQEVIPGFQWASVYYGPSLLDERPDVGERFMIAYLEAVRQYNQGKTPRNLEILARSTRLSEQLLRDACWPSIRADGQVDVDQLLQFQAWARSKGFVDKDVPRDQFVDRRFVERANAALAK
jgi:NitT/TauT family transport system substrate-binding protein